MLVLGIETSCDETAAALVTDDRRVLASIVRSQLADHAPYGGVVPEIAARAHLDHLGPVVERAFAEAGVGWNAIDAVAATTGPGLIGGVIVGSMAAKAMAAALGRPFVAVNHLEGHALTARLTDDLAFPYLLLLASGGHCQLLAVEAVGRYRRLGGTVDDAIGEAFDKTAKMLGLGYPGGPAVERAAAGGDPGRFALPRPFLGRPGADFSFSGLKTAVRQRIEALPADSFDEQALADMAAAFQEAVTDVVTDRTRNAAMAFAVTHGPGRPLVIAGGVAANRRLRSALAGLANEFGVDLVAPPLELCTDNGAMIAWAGIERLRLGHPGRLDAAPRPRWPLDAPDMALDGVSITGNAP